MFMYENVYKGMCIVSICKKLPYTLLGAYFCSISKSSSKKPMLEHDLVAFLTLILNKYSIFTLQCNSK